MELFLFGYSWTTLKIIFFIYLVLASSFKVETRTLKCSERPPFIISFKKQVESFIYTLSHYILVF